LSCIAAAAATPTITLAVQQLPSVVKGFRERSSYNAGDPMSQARDFVSQAREIGLDVASACRCG
jgi:hypothetical protein